MSNPMLKQIFTITFSTALLVASVGWAGCISIFKRAPFDTDGSRDFDIIEFKNFSERRFTILDKNGDLPSNSKIHPISEKLMRTDKEKGKHLAYAAYMEQLDEFFYLFDENDDKKIGLGEYKKICRQGWIH
jgi:hypothetical protein